MKRHTFATLKGFWLGMMVFRSDFTSNCAGEEEAYDWCREMKRMERPHLNKSAELRRFIELEYAAEQAGFILDGTILRQAGRMWGNSAKSYLAGLNPAGPATDKPTTKRTRSTTDTSIPEQGSRSQD